MDPTHGVEAWFASMGGNPLLIFQGVALCALVHAPGRHGQALRCPPAAHDRNDRAQRLGAGGARKERGHNTAAMERLKDSIRWRGAAAMIRFLRQLVASGEHGDRGPRAAARPRAEESGGQGGLAQSGGGTQRGGGRCDRGRAMANGAIRAPSKSVNHSSEGGDAQDKSDSNGVVTHFGDPYFKGARWPQATVTTLRRCVPCSSPIKQGYSLVESLMPRRLPGSFALSSGSQREPLGLSRHGTRHAGCSGCLHQPL